MTKQTIAGVTIDSGTSTFDWGTREEWAKRERTWYGDDGNPHMPSCRLSRYASPDEVAALLDELRKLWSDYGRQMKAANTKAGPLARQPGERDKAYTERFLAMSEADQERSGEGGTFQYRRHMINRAIKELRADRVPSWRVVGEEPPPLFATIFARYDAAVDAADQKYAAEVAARPIDDAAWEKELERRRKWSGALT